MFLKETYKNIEDTLFYDEGTNDKVSVNFGSSIPLRNNGTSSIQYNSNGYYILTQTKNANSESFIPIPSLNGMSNIIIEYDSYCNQDGGSSGIIIYSNDDNWEKYSDDCINSGSMPRIVWRAYKRNGTFIENRKYASSPTNQKWVHYKYTITESHISMEITINDSIVFNESDTYPSSVMSSNTQIGIDCEWKFNTQTFYKNIKVKPL